MPRDPRAAKGKGKVGALPQGAWQAWEGSDGRAGSLQGTWHPVLRAESQFWHCLQYGPGTPMTHFMEPFCDSGPRAHRQRGVGERCWLYQGGISRLLWFGGPFVVGWPQSHLDQVVLGKYEPGWFQLQQLQTKKKLSIFKHSFNPLLSPFCLLKNSFSLMFSL